RHPRRDDRELPKPVEALGALGLDMITGDEVADLGGHLAAELGRVEPRDGPPSSRHPRSPVPRSATPASPARVRDAMPCTKTGPITPRAASPEMSGHFGP